MKTLNTLLGILAIAFTMSASADAADKKRPKFRPPAIVPAPVKFILPPHPENEQRTYCFVSPVSYFQDGEKRMKRLSTLSTQGYGGTARITVDETEVPPESEVQAAAKRNEIIARTIQMQWKDGTYVRDNSDFGKATKAVFTDGRTGEVQRFDWVWTQKKSKQRKLTAVKTVPEGVKWPEGPCPQVYPSM